jgi:hypothetical protein
LEIPVPKRKDVLDALRKGIEPMASDAYNATLKLGLDQERPELLRWTVACYELAIERGEFDATEVRQRLGGEWVQLKPLVSLGILAQARPSTDKGHRGHYWMPDKDGVGRALRELGVLPPD